MPGSEPFLESPKPEWPGTLVVECGIGSCQHRWPLQLKPGSRNLLEYPKCKNSTQQVLLG